MKKLKQRIQFLDKKNNHDLTEKERELLLDMRACIEEMEFLLGPYMTQIIRDCCIAVIGEMQHILDHEVIIW